MPLDELGNRYLVPAANGVRAIGEIAGTSIDAKFTLQPGELDALNARVAPPEAFRDARIEYSSSLRLLRFSVDKRANGQPFIKITSVAPINEPFVDMLIEVSWPAGRIQREYPILLDPPGYSNRGAPPSVAAAPATSTSRPADAPPAPAPAASSSAPASSAPAAAPASEPPKADTGAPSVFVALQEQLGLKLDPTRTAVKVLIVDSAQRPAEN